MVLSMRTGRNQPGGEGNGTRAKEHNSKAIEENIQKKKAQIVLDAMEPAYKEAVTKSIENNNKIRELQGQYLDDLAKKKEAELRGDANVAAEYTKSAQKKIDAINRLNDTQKGYYDDIEQYELYAKDISEGNYNAVIEGYGRVSDAVIENKDITLDTLAETLEIEKENLDERQRMYNENASQINTDLRNAAEGSVKAVSDQFMNNEVCGIVTSPIEHLDTSEVNAQLTAALNGLIGLRGNFQKMQRGTCKTRLTNIKLIT